MNYRTTSPRAPVSPVHPDGRRHPVSAAREARRADIAHGVQRGDAAAGCPIRTLLASADGSATRGAARRRPRAFLEVLDLRRPTRRGRRRRRKPARRRRRPRPTCAHNHAAAAASRRPPAAPVWRTRVTRRAERDASLGDVGAGFAEEARGAAHGVGGRHRGRRWRRRLGAKHGGAALAARCRRAPGRRPHVLRRRRGVGTLGGDRGGSATGSRRGGRRRPRVDRQRRLRFTHVVAASGVGGSTGGGGRRRRQRRRGGDCGCAGGGGGGAASTTTGGERLCWRWRRRDDNGRLQGDGGGGLRTTGGECAGAVAEACLLERGQERDAAAARGRRAGSRARGRRSGPGTRHPRRRREERGRGGLLGLVSARPCRGGRRSSARRPAALPPGGAARGVSSASAARLRSASAAASRCCPSRRRRGGGASASAALALSLLLGGGGGGGVARSAAARVAASPRGLASAARRWQQPHAVALPARRRRGARPQRGPAFGLGCGSRFDARLLVRRRPGEGIAVGMALRPSYLLPRLGHGLARFVAQGPGRRVVEVNKRRSLPRRPSTATCARRALFCLDGVLALDESRPARVLNVSVTGRGRALTYRLTSGKSTGSSKPTSLNKSVSGTPLIRASTSVAFTTPWPSDTGQTVATASTAVLLSCSSTAISIPVAGRVI